MWDVLVIGAGAAGLVAAERSAARGLKTLLLEKNRKPGVKILISGGTRCNVTHATDACGIVTAFGRNGSFLHSALARFSPQDLVALLESEGVATKVEAAGKVFPRSDRAWDVLQALLSRMHRAGARMALAEPALDIQGQDGLFRVRTPSSHYVATRVIVTTGGLSYPRCGTTGDGYGWARQFGHSVVPTVPALAPLTSSDSWVHALTGLTVSDTVVTLSAFTKPSRDRTEQAGSSNHWPQPATLKQYARRVKDSQSLTERGPLLFTHFGLSGPAPMNISRSVSYAGDARDLRLECDFLPHEPAESVFRQLHDSCQRQGRKRLGSIVGQSLPSRLAEQIVERAHIRADKPAAEVSNVQLRTICELIKKTEIRVTGTMGFGKAEVTAGGIALDEIDSRTMESKLCRGLYFAGEVLDLDGPIGGYNFQSAFSTGWLAGSQVARSDGVQ
jgi:hypothetical protein